MTTTTLLGANGKLGSILSTCVTQAGVGWRTVARSGGADVIWSGRFDDPAVDLALPKGGTVINMIGTAAGDAATLQATNVDFVSDLLEHATTRGVAHVVLASSAAVYGAGHGAPFAEDSMPAPITPYGTSKLAMEQVAMNAPPGPAVTILRIGNVAGADALLLAAKHHEALGRPVPLHRWPDGAAATRSYIGPLDLFGVVRAMTHPPHNGPPRLINVTHPQAVTLDDLLAGYRKHLIPALEWIDQPAPDTIPQRVTLSADKVQGFVNFSISDTPADALAQQVAGLGL